MNFKEVVFNSAPFLAITGQELRAYDADDTGTDDFVGELLLFLSETLSAIKNNEDLPAFPEILARGTSGKISNKAALALRIASAVLVMASFSVAEKYQKPLKYVRQTITNLLLGRVVPPGKLY